MAEIDATATRRARTETLVLVPLLIAVLVRLLTRRTRSSAPTNDTVVRLATVVVIVVIGWWIARDIGRLAGPALMRRMDPAGAGTVGFLIRLTVLLLVVLAALWIAKVSPAAIVAGGAFTAVVLGLAAQQTLGNLIAGAVLLSARPSAWGTACDCRAGRSAGGSREWSARWACSTPPSAAARSACSFRTASSSP